MLNYEAKQTIEEKANWGNGVWQAEPDVAKWTDDGTGLPVEVKRDPTNGTLSFAIGVEAGHPADGKEPAEVPNLPPQGRMSTERRDGKWWFVVSYDQPADGHPGRQLNIERYRTMLDAQHDATAAAHAIHRFANQAPRTGAGSVSLAAAVAQARAPEGITTEVPALIREKEDALGVGDPTLRAAADHGLSGPAVAPAPPSNEASAAPSPEEAQARATDNSGAPDADEALDSDSGTSSGSSKRRKKS
jgi:hypothetical protein